MKEIVDQVDEKDNVIGQVTRKEMREKNLWHRGTGVVIFNSKGEILIHKRTMTKDAFQGYYDSFFGGVLEAGETYEENATRELEEEAGLKDVEMEFVFKYAYDSENTKVHVHIFKVISDGPFKFQEEEVEFAKFVSKEELMDMIKKEKFIPDGLMAIRIVLGEDHEA